MSRETPEVRYESDDSHIDRVYEAIRELDRKAMQSAAAAHTIAVSNAAAKARKV